MSSNTPCCYIGLPQWNHPEWQDGPLAGNSQHHPLGRYARYFSSVEGNTTFYGLPSADSVARWLQETPDHFRFCFKFPQSISHQASLRNCTDELNTLFQTMAPLQEKLGLLCLQLPETFSPEHIPTLAAFFNQLPNDFQYSIEVRHPDFFRKDAREKAFNQLLLKTGVNRTTFDTRPLFKHPRNDAITQEALSAKPNLPVHAIATGQYPMVRFITALNWQSSQHYLNPWIRKVSHWLDEGRSPFVFLHTPSNGAAPEVAHHFAQQLAAERPGQVAFIHWPDQQQQQSDLF